MKTEKVIKHKYQHTIKKVDHLVEQYEENIHVLIRERELLIADMKPTDTVDANIRTLRQILKDLHDLHIKKS